MRQIKLRAYIKNLNWVVSVEMICFNTKTVEVDLTSGNGDTSEYHFDEVKLMQCTGLKDKNGVDIYEGDIVDQSYISPLSNEKVIQHYIVEWENGLHKMKFISNKPHYNRYLWMQSNQVSVIGNIYENPELLEVST